MTAQMCCGYECGVSGNGTHWSFSGAGTKTFDTSVKRSGARSIQFNTSTNTAYGGSNSGHASTTRHIGRFYINFSTIPSADTRIASFGDNDSTGPCIRFKQSDSKIYAAIGTTLGASGVAVTTGQWYLIDYDFNVNTGGSDSCDGKVDGVALAQATGTGTSTGDQRDDIGIHDNCTSVVYYDDVIFSDTAGDYPFGEGYINHFVPTSDGTHNVAGANDFERSATGTDIDNTTTTAFQLIDDVPLKSGVVAEYINLIAPPNATDYVEVVFGPAPGISTPTTAPRMIDVIVAYASASAGTNNIRLALNDNGSLDDTLNTNTGPGTTATYARKGYPDPPSAATVWTVLSGNGNFNNVRMRCFTSDAAPDPWWASAMIEAEFPANLPPAFSARPAGQIGQNQMNQLLAQ